MSKKLFIILCLFIGLFSRQVISEEFRDPTIYEWQWSIFEEDTTTSSPFRIRYNETLALDWKAEFDRIAEIHSPHQPIYGNATVKRMICSPKWKFNMFTETIRYFQHCIYGLPIIHPGIGTVVILGY